MLRGAYARDNLTVQARANLPSVDPLGDRDAAAPLAPPIYGYATASDASPPAVGMTVRGFGGPKSTTCSGNR